MQCYSPHYAVRLHRSLIKRDLEALLMLSFTVILSFSRHTDVFLVSTDQNTADLTLYTLGQDYWFNDKGSFKSSVSEYLILRESGA